MHGNRLRREFVHAEHWEALAEYAVDVEIERASRRCFEQGLQRAFMAGRAEPAPIAEQVNIGALAGETCFLNRDDLFVRPMTKCVRRERPAKSLVMSLGRLGANARACALSYLAREARTRAALQSKQAQAQGGPGGDIVQRLARYATGGERTVQAPQFPRLDGVGAQVIRRRRFVHDL